MLNAVLKPPPEHRVEYVEILNPITEPVVLDEKLSILDIRARDQSGRQFNVEMQMVTHAALQSRFLYYWAKLYSSQLESGDRYDLLRPVVSICFLDALLFPTSGEYHLPFRLWNPESQLVLSKDLEIHLFQLPNFTKTDRELSEPLDLWLYFLNNGMQLDPEDLPTVFQVPELDEAMGALRMLTQDEIERARYEDREKARRDALSWERAMERRLSEGVAKAAAEAMAKGLAEGRAKGRAEGHTEGLAVGTAKGLIGQIRLCEQILKLAPHPEEKLQSMSLDELQIVLERLRGQLP